MPSQEAQASHITGNRSASRRPSGESTGTPDGVQGGTLGGTLGYRYQKGRACGAFFEDAAVDADAAADGRLPVTP